MKKNINRAFHLTAAAAMTAAVVMPVQADEVTAAAADTKEEVFSAVADVQGSFEFSQDVISPSDEIFNLFGTAATGVCATPSFAFDSEEETDYYINVGGAVQKAQALPLSLLKQQGQKRTMVCACASGGATAQAAVTGVRIADILQIAEVDADANTIVFRGSDGYTQSMPLGYVLEKDAMLVYRIGESDVPEGTQIWMPGTVASYFTRKVVGIELVKSDEVPEVRAMPEENRVQVAFTNTVEGTFDVGDEITFTGYADDLGQAVAAVEFSMDGGATWTACETPDTTAEKWVCWGFTYRPEAAGKYKLTVRARTVDGTVSPLAATVEFEVK